MLVIMSVSVLQERSTSPVTLTWSVAIFGVEDRALVDPDELSVEALQISIAAVVHQACRHHPLLPQYSITLARIMV